MSGIGGLFLNDGGFNGIDSLGVTWALISHMALLSAIETSPSLVETLMLLRC
jgi:hypothetical protein